ncbi:MAG: hypothetical protein AAGF23_15240 [Acidobacteriota bacterium]
MLDEETLFLGVVEGAQRAVAVETLLGELQAVAVEVEVMLCTLP